MENPFEEFNILIIEDLASDKRQDFIESYKKGGAFFAHKPFA